MSKDPDVSGAGEEEKGVRVEAGAACTLDIDWKPDKKGGCSLPSLLLPTHGKKRKRGWTLPCCSCYGCCCGVFFFEKLRNPSTHTHTHTDTGMHYRPLSVFQNVSLDVLAPANRARDSAWQTPPQRESSCHLDK